MIDLIERIIKLNEKGSDRFSFSVTYYGDFNKLCFSCFDRIAHRNIEIYANIDSKEQMKDFEEAISFYEKTKTSGG